MDSWMNEWMDGKQASSNHLPSFVHFRSFAKLVQVSFRERGRERAIVICGWMMKNDISLITCQLSAHKFVWWWWWRWLLNSKFRLFYSNDINIAHRKEYRRYYQFYTCRSISRKNNKHYIVKLLVVFVNHLFWFIDVFVHCNCCIFQTFRVCLRSINTFKMKICEWFHCSD